MPRSARGARHSRRHKPAPWAIFDVYRWERLRRIPDFRRDAQHFIDLGCPVGKGGTIRAHPDAFPGMGKALSWEEFSRYREVCRTYGLSRLIDPAKRISPEAMAVGPIFVDSPPRQLKRKSELARDRAQETLRSAERDFTAAEEADATGRADRASMLRQRAADSVQDAAPLVRAAVRQEHAYLSRVRSLVARRRSPTARRLRRVQHENFRVRPVPRGPFQLPPLPLKRVHLSVLTRGLRVLHLVDDGHSLRGVARHLGLSRSRVSTAYRLARLCVGDEELLAHWASGECQPCGLGQIDRCEYVRRHGPPQLRDRRWTREPQRIAGAEGKKPRRRPPGAGPVDRLHDPSGPPLPARPTRRRPRL